jgi:TM2 domain-containing membrane protein YozV
MAGNGCLKDTLAGVGCLTLLVIGGALGWHYRGQIAGLYHSFRRPARNGTRWRARTDPRT